jgi:hypothetical protein
MLDSHKNYVDVVFNDFVSINNHAFLATRNRKVRVMAKNIVHPPQLAASRDMSPPQRQDDRDGECNPSSQAEGEKHSEGNKQAADDDAEDYEKHVADCVVHDAMYSHARKGNWPRNTTERAGSEHLLAQRYRTSKMGKSHHKHHTGPSRTDSVAKLHPTWERDAVAERNRIQEAELAAEWCAAWDEQEALRDLYMPMMGGWEDLTRYGRKSR